MHWATALSEQTDLDRALAEVIAAVRAEIAPASVDLAIAFISPHYAARYLDCHSTLRRALPSSVLLGCSAGGVIGGGHEIEQKPAISLTAAHLPDVHLKPFRLDGSDLPDEDASPRAWHTALDIPPAPTPHLLVLADPFSFPAPRMLTGLDYAYPASATVGGLASGASRPGQNILYLNDAASPDGLVGLALSGNISVETIVAQGCRPVGERLRITSSRGNLLLELDDQPALKRVREIIAGLSGKDRRLAQQSLHLGVLCRGLSGPATATEFLIRNFAGVDPESGAMAVGELLHDGQTVQLHVRDAATSREDLALHLQHFAKTGGAARARGGLLFSCLGRGVHLYGQPDHDSELFQETLGPLPLGGFFCNGEIGPIGGVTHLHGFTSAFGIFGPASDERS